MKIIVDRHCQLLVDELALQQLTGPPSGGVVSLFLNRLLLLATYFFLLLLLDIRILKVQVTILNIMIGNLQLACFLYI